jgi:CheY-like chemotaxis protein
MAELAGKRILVVEDEALLAMTIEDVLADAGATVVGPASAVARALDLAADGPLDAALLDINLGDERSDAVAEMLRNRGVPVVLATGYGSASVPGDTPVLAKPYREKQIVEALAAAIAQARKNSR